jgi:hypothetical protein
LKLLSQELGGKKFILKGQLSELEWSKQFKNHQAKLDAKMNEFLQTATRATAGTTRSKARSECDEVESVIVFVS